MQDNKPIGKELVLVQFEDLSNAVYTYNSHIQLDDIGELTKTLTPIVRYPSVQALAETTEVGDVLAYNVEAEEEIEVFEDDSNDDSNSEDSCAVDSKK